MATSNAVPIFPGSTSKYKKWRQFHEVVVKLTAPGNTGPSTLALRNIHTVDGSKHTVRKADDALKKAVLREVTNCATGRTILSGDFNKLSAPFSNFISLDFHVHTKSIAPHQLHDCLAHESHISQFN